MLVILEVCKIGTILYIYSYRNKCTENCHKKQFLTGTYSNQILYLNSVSESKKTEDYKICFPENGAMVLLEVHFKRACAI